MTPAIEDVQVRAQAIADKLLGTCDQKPDDLLYADADLAEAFDALVRECEGCNWWVETHEVDDEGLCEDCQDD